MTHETKAKNTSFSFGTDKGKRGDIHVDLPNGRSIDLSVGALIGIAIALTILPFNWIIIGLIGYGIYYYNQDKHCTSRSDSARKTKVKNEDSDDVFIDAA